MIGPIAQRATKLSPGCEPRVGVHPHEILLQIKEIGLQDCHEVVEMLAPEQVREILDLDGWKGLEICPAKLGEWFCAMFAANREKAVQQIASLDLELLCLLLKQNATVYNLSEEEEEPEDAVGLRWASPEGYYAAYFAEGELAETLYQFIGQLYQTDINLARRLLESSRWETESVLEEEALRWRDGRMQDLGFAPVEERAGILAYVDPGSPSPDFCEQKSPSPVNGRGVKRLFALGIAGVDDQVKHDLVSQLANTVNQVLLARNADFGDAEMVRETSTWVQNCIEEILMYKTGGNLEATRQLLSNTPIKKLFQMGRSLEAKRSAA